MTHAHLTGDGYALDVRLWEGRWACLVYRFRRLQCKTGWHATAEASARLPLEVAP